MREIEFRAFVKDKGKIFDVKTIDFSYKMISFEEENKPTDTMRMLDQIELMQYTGLKDKNGKKIFEGDIHHHYDTHSKKDRWYIVCCGEFHDTVYNFDGYGWYFAEINGDDTESFEGNEQDYVNIVGNIYDNPELLGGENESKGL